MANAEADRPNGLHNLWGFGWTSGGMIAALLVAGIFVWIYGSVAVGWWRLIQDYRALPKGLKGILGATAFAIAYMGWTIVRLDKQHRALRDRVSHLESETSRQKHNWSDYSAS